jgi:LPS-assembly protein
MGKRRTVAKDRVAQRKASGAPSRRVPPLPLLLGLVLAGPLALPAPAAAQGMPGLENRTLSNDPVTFTAEEVAFDQNSDTVIARGRVEAWQGDRVLRADEFTYNRRTGVATATGNVVLIEPDGNILFADRAELTGGMRDAALEGLRALLAGNARMVANGARRTGGTVTDLSRVIYTACDLCPTDPDAPPLWQLRARVASLHSDEQRVRYRDASLDFFGLPLLYTPYLSHAAPGAQRASGFLSPSFGITRWLGGFAEIPFYWAIDDSSDAIISGTVATKQAGNVGLIYRRRFNSGLLTLDTSVGELNSASNTTSTTPKSEVGAHIFSTGDFSLDETWRAGFQLNRTTSVDYLRTYRYGSPRVLTSRAYLEGFSGPQGYARLDSRWYQGLSTQDNVGLIPFVLPYGYADWAFPTDGLGGQLTLDTQAYSILRSAGTDTRRLAARALYEVPVVGNLGEVWTFRAQGDALGGWVGDLQLAPNYGSANDNGNFTLANVRAAVDLRWPLLRPAGEWGAHLIEPRVQFVTGPKLGSQASLPNEDSLDIEFTDANLFALNRFPGRDRQEGGTRVDAALRGAWLFPNGGQLEGLVGRSYRTAADSAFPLDSGLEKPNSDWVARARLAPVPWLEVLGRTRLDGNTLENRFWDVTGTVFAGRTSFSAGYLNTQPAYNGSYPERNEIAAGAQFHINEYWRAGMFGRYDIYLDRPVAAQLALTYEDECLIFDARFVRRWAEDPTTQRQYPSNMLLFFRVTLKTIGDFGFRAI